MSTMGVGSIMQMLILLCGTVIVYGMYKFLKVSNQMKDSSMNMSALEEEFMILKIRESISRN